MQSGINGSVALVTASSSGLGLAVAKKLVTAGARVVVNYASDEKRANEALAQLQSISRYGTASVDPSPRYIAVKADVSRREEIESLVGETVRTFGKLDLVVSNAGWTKFASFVDLDQNVDESVWDRCFAINVKAHLFLLHAARPYLQQAQGAFIMTSSVAGVKPSGSSIVRIPRLSSDYFIEGLTLAAGILGHQSGPTASF